MSIFSRLDEIEDCDLDSELRTHLDDMEFLMERYIVLRQRRYPHETPYQSGNTALRHLQTFLSEYLAGRRRRDTTR
ncbi:MAG TPA: hypothetical protein VKQ30_10065 [Ktedonobacterales bacterium]|nr:hypothetical protein [Ktedonobacterales bacterium]